MARKQHLKWRTVVQGYDCDVCGASTGEQCVTSTGRITFTPHAPRSARASADGWQDHGARIVAQLDTTSWCDPCKAADHEHHEPRLGYVCVGCDCPITDPELLWPA